MLITCPKCSSKYKIPSEIKLAEGKKVQCSACGHIFEFHPESEEKQEKISLLPPEDAVLSMTSRTEKITIKTLEPEKKLIPHTAIALPEAFRPLQKQPKSSNTPYFWVVLCTILLLGFCAMIWMYRNLWVNQALFTSSTPSVKHAKKVKTLELPKVKRDPSGMIAEHSKVPEKRIEIGVKFPEPIITEYTLSPIASSPIQTSQTKVNKMVQETIIYPDSPKGADLSIIAPDAETEMIVPVQEEQKIVIPSIPSKPTIQSVHFRKTPTGEAVLIEGVLKNTTSETLSVPEKVYALGYDTAGVLAFEKEIYLPNGILYPDMEQPFFGTYSPAKEDIQWVDVVLQK